jgi:hypothetical protein
MGTTDKIYGSKVPKRARADEAAGTNINPGPYEAVIKNVLDTTRSGRLQVWIPELGSGDQENISNWYTVSYASPFAGTTSQPPGFDKVVSNFYAYTQHTYGFWAVPPDVGNVVLVIFINGDPNRGYWFACVVNKLGKNMIPGIAGAGKSKIDDREIGSPDVKKALTDDSVWPLCEANENEGANVQSDFLDIKKPPHEFQVKRYIQQGLDRDPLRGAVSSSGQRNIPSAVYGWSTPGRQLKGDPAEDPALQAKVESGDIGPEDVFTLARKGGHTFVMDDGDFYGKSQLVRMRTAAGHQVLLDDTNGMTYVINSEGTCWIELAKNGQMHIFTSGGFNVRSEGDINFHSDTNIKMHAADKIKIFAGNQIDINTKTFIQLSTDLSKIYASKVQIGGSSTVNISAGGVGSFKAGELLQYTGGKIHLNTSAAPVVQKPEPIPKFLHSDTLLNTSNGLWEISPNKINSIVNIAPTHEPWSRESGASQTDKASGG